MYEVILAGLLQGLLEWLPVSSSGNVAVYFMQLANLSPVTAVRLALSLHLATALAGSTYYYRFVLNALRRPLGLEARILIVPLLTGVPTGFLLYRSYEAATINLSLDAVMALIGVFLIVTGTILIAQGRAGGARTIGEMGYFDLLMVGVVEGIAVLPGLSRSGLVATYLLLRGYNPSASVKTSFVTGISATLLAALYTLYRYGTGGYQPIQILLGLIAAYAAGLLSLAFLDRLAEKMIKSIGLFLIVYGLLIVLLHVPVVLG